MLSTKRYRLSLLSILFSINLLFVPKALAEHIDNTKNIEDVVHGPSAPLINLGIVVKNDTYTIYRSAALGYRGTKHLSKYLEAHDLPFPKTIIHMNSAGYVFPLYFAIHEYKLSLSEKYGAFDFFHSFGNLRTFVDGQNPYYPRHNIDTAQYLGPIGRRHFEYHDDAIDGGVDAFLEVMDLVLDPARQPVLFHCLGGLHRTGMIAMALRFIQGGYWVDGPKTRKHGLDLNPAEYEYSKFNPIFFRKNNIKFIRAFRNDPRFIELQERYHDALSQNENLYFGDEENSEEPESLGDENFAGRDD
jgi:hypothetical protein